MGRLLDVRPDSSSNKFRRRRIERLNLLINSVLSKKRTCSIIDIGGTYNFWLTWKDLVDWSLVNITCINLVPEHFELGKGVININMIRGDACNLAGIADSSFDIAFSNSVIEHVGGWSRMQDMANEIRRIAPFYLVQTPYFWFPIEPHARTPFMHWVPESIAYRIVMARRCGYWERRTTVSSAVEAVQSAKLLDFRQMCSLFGDAVVVRERFLGLTKSLIAIKSE